MNKKIELAIYLVLYALFGISSIRSVPESDYYFFYSLVSFVQIGVLFVVTRYFIARKLRTNKIFAALSILAILMVLCFLPSAYLFASYVDDLSDAGSQSGSEPIFSPLVIKETGLFVVLPVILGLLHLIDFRKPLVRKTARYMGIALLILTAAFLVKYAIDVNYQGNESIRFISGEFNSLDDILKQEQFRDKVVYVDLWFSSCSPCIQDFRRLPPLKAQLKNNDVEYLYLARETSHPHSRQLWKNAIKKHNLSGWHFYMTDEFNENLWALIRKKLPDVYPAYPHYLLVNRSNEIVSYKARRPSDQPELVREIKNLLSSTSSLDR